MDHQTYFKPVYTPAEIKRKDRAFQQQAGTGNCEACGQWGERTRHHIIRRRNLKTRWDESNCISVCYRCHDLIHRGLLAERKLPILQQKGAKVEGEGSGVREL